ncbi:MAG: response regulator [Nitrospirota bacterium]
MTQDKILIIDDEPPVLASLRRALSEEPYRVLTAESAAAGLELLRQHTAKVVISDERMPGMSGSELLTAVRNQFPYTVRIILTGHADAGAAMRAINQGEIYRFITKPWNDLELKLLIRSAIEKYNLEEANRGLIIKNYNTLSQILRVIDPETEYVCQCSRCQKTIDMKFHFCPFCGAHRRDLCRSCSMPVEAAWMVCPFCGAAQQ